MDRLTLFGLFAVTAMLVCYALEERSRWFTLAFAAAVRSDRPTGSSKARGRSDCWRRSGRSSRCGGGG